MTKQLQLIDVGRKYCNGNAVLNVVLNRLHNQNLSFDVLSKFCSKLPPLSVHDIKDVLEQMPCKAISPECALILSSLPCEAHHRLYQKSFAQSWLDFSADHFLSQNNLKVKLAALHTIAQWEHFKLVHFDQFSSRRFMEIYLKSQKGNQPQCWTITPNEINFAVKLTENCVPMLVERKDDIGAFFNQMHDLLTADTFKRIQRICQKLKIWDTDVCSNLRARYEKEMLSGVVDTNKFSSVRKI